MYDTALMQNPGSPGWAAGGGFAGRVVGGLPGLFMAMAMAEETPEGGNKAPASAMIVRWLGQIGGAAGGAAIGAPDGQKGRAAVGAALGGAVPFLGAPLAAVGAYVATMPKSRNANPLSPAATWTLVILGLAGAAGLTYAGVKALEARDKNGNAAPQDDTDPISLLF